MRRLRSGEAHLKICVPILERTPEAALRRMKEANRIADLIELRIDSLKTPSLGALLAAGKRPCIVTNRRKEEGGKFAGEERERLTILKEACALGAAYADVEVGSGKEFLKEMFACRRKTRIILSSHDFQKTPSPQELERLLTAMIRFGAAVVKIVTYAQSFEDNLKVLALIPSARKRGQKILSFAMGEKGRVSRIFAPFLGAAWTYAALETKRTSAPGQLTVQEMKSIWEFMNK
jgi:3-dehydroquinate dehydratase type I